MPHLFVGGDCIRSLASFGLHCKLASCDAQTVQCSSQSSYSFCEQSKRLLKKLGRKSFCFPDNTKARKEVIFMPRLFVLALNKRLGIVYNAVIRKYK